MPNHEETIREELTGSPRLGSYPGTVVDALRRTISTLVELRARFGLIPPAPTGETTGGPRGVPRTLLEDAHAQLTGSTTPGQRSRWLCADGRYRTLREMGEQIERDVAVFAANLPPQEPPPNPPQPPADGINPRPDDPLVQTWVSRYKLVERYSTALNALGSEKASDFYRYAYDVDAVIACYEATGSQTYLDQAVAMARRAIDSCYDVPGGFKGKVVGDNYHGSSWANKEAALDDSYLFRYITRLVRVMPPGADRDSILTWTERNIWDKWTSRGMSNLYRERTHMQSHWGAMGANLYAVTGKAKYREVADQVVANFRAQLRDHPVVGSSAYWWNAVWSSYSRPGQDVDHGNALAVMITDTHDVLGQWTTGDIARFCNLVRFIIDRGKPDAIDGSGSNTGWIPEFAKLGRYNRATFDALAGHVNTGQAQFRANMALNAACLAA